MSWRILAAALLLAAGACTTIPDRVESLEQARAAVAAVNRDPLVGKAAPDELREAEARLSAADAAYADRDLEGVEHNAYIARRHAEVAQEQITEARLREEIEASEVARKNVQLEARTAEAEQAKAAAAQARSEAEMARDQAERLQEELAALNAQQTERGLVLTLGDVLFDTARATLKPGAGDTLDRLAAFMRDAADRRVLIEGHTDSRGSDEYNAALSAQRAQAVREALMARGIAADRIAAVGAGEGFPVASNDTAAGMQLNRRVEIVISDEQGAFPGAATRPGMTPAFPSG
jgi:outer membrane protein OmpA-like peptidoglycan-associated protein